MHKMLTSVFMLLLTEFVVATPEVQPILKSGSCPVGYYTSGNYCVPSGKQSHFAIPNRGSCPAGYYNSGDYCIASSENSRMAIPKAGSCPSGYYNSGSYCLSSK